MGAVCDVYDAVTSDRPYKAGWDPAHCPLPDGHLEGPFRHDGLPDHSSRASASIPTGSLVRMRSGRLAVVLEQNTLLP